MNNSWERTERFAKRRRLKPTMSANDVDDEDVVFEGSPLHEHLRKLGMSEEVEPRKVECPKSEILVKRKSTRLTKSKKKSSNENGKGFYFIPNNFVY